MHESAPQIADDGGVQSPSARRQTLCGAPYGERSPERVNVRNGYRERVGDTRVGTIELAIPKLRTRDASRGVRVSFLMCPFCVPALSSVLATHSETSQDARPPS